MKRKIIILIVGCWLLPILGFAQDTPIKILNIGDKIPNLEFKKIVGYKAPVLKTAELHGKILIIDFWATWCGSCITELPKLSKLQQDFKDEILILPISYEKKEVIDKALKRLPSLKNVHLPLVYDDKRLNKMFPHRSIPHDVIIDGKGTIIAITSAENINTETIKQILANQKVDLPIKQSGGSLDFEKPLFIDSIGQRLMLTYGILTKGYNGQPSRLGRRGQTMIHEDTRIYGINQLPINLYKLALFEKIVLNEKFPLNRIKFSVKDTTLFEDLPSKPSPNEMERFRKEHSFCFDFFVPPTSKQNVYKFFKNYLDNYFNLNSKLDSAIMDCYVVTGIDKNLYTSKGGENLEDMGMDLWTIRNFPIQELINRLNGKSKVMIIDESGIKINIDISLAPNFNDFEKLRSELNKNGLNLTKTKRKLQIMFISDRI